MKSETPTKRAPLAPTTPSAIHCQYCRGNGGPRPTFASIDERDHHMRLAHKTTAYLSLFKATIVIRRSPDLKFHCPIGACNFAHQDAKAMRGHVGEVHENADGPEQVRLVITGVRVGGGESNIQEVLLTRPDRDETSEEESEESDYDPEVDSSRGTPPPDSTPRRETRTSDDTTDKTTKTPGSSRKESKTKITTLRTSGGKEPAIGDVASKENDREASSSDPSPPPPLDTPPQTQTEPTHTQEQAPALPSPQPTKFVKLTGEADGKTPAPAHTQPKQGIKRARETDDVSDAIEEVKRANMKRMTDEMLKVSSGGNIEEVTKNIEALKEFNAMCLATLKGLDEA
ncbi:hypothetical protein BJ508DRAFT_314735 [Ascobolus immersus RN42]|uniref:C2H2-type domain-containing protein n=1 Tax=Ascobolus immersus RN42 TaxID=1160509 RepID=A0A3N4HKM9_ASCIM|nr:hypothetical protein BJ508DRAFT_314735 [Ascobolus immersus RN42]